MAKIDPELLLRQLDYRPGASPLAVTAVEFKIRTSITAKLLCIQYLNEEGIPTSATGTAALMSLAKAYCIAGYLKTWRNRINQNFALLGGDEEPEPAPAPAPAAQPASTAQTKETLEALFRQVDLTTTRLVEEKLAKATLKVDPSAKEALRALATDAGRAAAEAYAKAHEKPRRLELLVPPATQAIDLGLQHEKFPQLLRACSARDQKGFHLNIWLTGPTGSGKTTAAENVAKALGLPFGSDGSLDADYKVLGFRDAHGHIVSTQFLDIFKGGGVYVADEIDNWMPSALLALNAALANGFVSTPGGLLRRHPDACVIACANTWGLGATNDYVGRNKLDAATLDRFHPKLDWPVDESLEMAVADAQAPGGLGEAWHEIIIAARRNARTQGLKVIISPRATFNGLALLRSGFPCGEVIAMTFAAGLSSEQKNNLCGNLVGQQIVRIDRIVAQAQTKAQTKAQPEAQPEAQPSAEAFAKAHFDSYGPYNIKGDYTGQESNTL